MTARDDAAGLRERVEVGRVKHGVGSSDYLPGNVQHLVSPIVGTLRLRERDTKPITLSDIRWFIDRLSLVLDMARMAESTPAPAPAADGGEVARVLYEHRIVRDAFSPYCACGKWRDKRDRGNGHAAHIADALAPLLDHIRRTARAEVVEEIAAAIERRPTPTGSDHFRFGYERGIEDAARIARATGGPQ